MTRVAGIDCGTNSIRLLVADVDPGVGDAGVALTDVCREMRIVRLGQGVDRTGRLAPEALERTRAALAEYATLIGTYGVARIRMVATSATRDASNRDEFVAMVRGALAVVPEVITGDEEARLSFAGAVTGLPGLTGPMLLADIGGGSTELVLGDTTAGAARAYSMDVGSVRLTERHLHDDPPTLEQVQAVVADVDAALDRAAETVPLDSGARLVGVAGTVTTMAAIALGLSSYRAERVHGSVLSAATVRRVAERLLGMSHAEREAVPVIHPGRVDVICAGALVLRTIVERTGAAELVASEHDILDGIALSAGTG